MATKKKSLISSSKTTKKPARTVSAPNAKLARENVSSLRKTTMQTKAAFEWRQKVIDG